MTAEVLLQGIVSGLLMGLVYALIAAGLSLIFGLMETVDFAHGEFLMVAMLTSYWALALWRLDPLVSLPLAAGLLFVLGAMTYCGLIRWILDAPRLARIFATFGPAAFLRSAAQALWDVDFLVVKGPLWESPGALPHRQAAWLMGIDTQRMLALGRAHAHARVLSTGQPKRLEMARTLATRPRLGFPSAWSRCTWAR